MLTYAVSGMASLSSIKERMPGCKFLPAKDAIGKKVFD
jgi:hypothetical protein